MLPLAVNHCLMFAVELMLLLYSTGTNGDSKPNNTLFISPKTLADSYFPSKTIYQEDNGTKLCFNIQPNNTRAECCNDTDFNCNIEVKIDSQGKYRLNLTEEILSKQDIVVMKDPEHNYSCMPSQLYNKSSPGFFCSINRCLSESMKNMSMNMKLSKGSFRENLTEYVVSDNDTWTVSCNPSTTTTSINSSSESSTTTTSINSSSESSTTTTSINSSSQSSTTTPSNDNDTIDISINHTIPNPVDVMKNLSFVLEMMGNFGTATIKMGNITGVIAKLSQKNQANMNFAFTENAGVKIVKGENSNFTGPFHLMKIPKEASKLAVEGNGSFLGILLFPQQHADDSSKYYLNSEIVGIEMGAKIQNLSQPIEIQYSNVDKKGANASCMSWDGNSTDANGKSLWITDGCQTVETNNSITCQCTHLTFFAILMSPPPANISTSDVNTLTYITSIGCGLSLFFLIVGLFMHVLVRKGKASEATKILMNLFVAMLILNLSFLTNESISNLGIEGACVAIAAVLHYGMLATFTWFFMQALHLYLSLRRICTEVKHYMLKICITGWVIPAVVVIALLASQKYNSININTNEGKAATMCWISDAGIHQGVNIGYYAVVFVFTLSVFILTVRQIVLMPKAGKAQDNISIKSNTSTILSLFLLLGITWAFAFFSYGPLLIASYYIFTILNSFQGFFLFIYYYKSSKIIGDSKIHTQSSSTATSNTAVTSPYA
ncbi:adhesion G-protein coupled receptor G5 [Haplochromis burtoni]|uniref:adhesion G-protein coupled receptor G5 n=1 Tax=Haplochromis burtoni TaxID=8153 RepID=UPI0003BDA100|nr:adhesion G-protein coupled receptor G5 [Haplochromis burtoni]